MIRNVGHTFADTFEQVQTSLIIISGGGEFLRANCALNTTSVFPKNISVSFVKPIRSLQDLIIGEPKEIAYAKSVKGKYAQQILLDLDDCVIFLPQRVTDALTPHIDALKGHRIVVRGTRKFGNHETADFEFLEPL
ncbi:hypothetical protein ABEB36_009219 [Hypothenemus hampei]|uniref:Uncharacterized protein n=1 Tax=Hypothenemus hampei TaxID=57062 RepID=A0ABD1EPI9_HYPHA